MLTWMIHKALVDTESNLGGFWLQSFVKDIMPSFYKKLTLKQLEMWKPSKRDPEYLLPLWEEAYNNKILLRPSVALCKKEELLRVPKG